MVLWGLRHADRQAEAGTHAIAGARIKKHGHHTVKLVPGRTFPSCSLTPAFRSFP